jgi:hypothetical protein
VSKVEEYSIGTGKVSGVPRLFHKCTKSSKFLWRRGAPREKELEEGFHLVYLEGSNQEGGEEAKDHIGQCCGCLEETPREILDVVLLAGIKLHPRLMKGTK